jgi:hypothetical protein
MSDSSSSVRVGNWWFLNLHTVAFFAFVANAMSSLIPMWNLIVTLGSAGALGLALGLVSLLSSVLMLVFLIALHRNQGTLHIPRHLRLVALAGAVAFICLICWSLPPWIGQPNVDAKYYLAPVLTEISNFAQVLLLVALFRTDDRDTGMPVPVSSFLRAVTRPTVVVWGIWLAFNLFRGLMSPVAYMQVRDYAARIGRAAPSAVDVVGQLFLGILNAAILFSIPYIVSKGFDGSTEAGATIAGDQQQVTGSN